MEPRAAPGGTALPSVAASAAAVGGQRPAAAAAAVRGVQNPRVNPRLYHTGGSGRIPWYIHSTIWYLPTIGILVHRPPPARPTPAGSRRGRQAVAEARPALPSVALRRSRHLRDAVRNRRIMIQLIYFQRPPHRVSLRADDSPSLCARCVCAAPTSQWRPGRAPAPENGCPSPPPAAAPRDRRGV